MDSPARGVHWEEAFAWLDRFAVIWGFVDNFFEILGFLLFLFGLPFIVFLIFLPSGRDKILKFLWVVFNVGRIINDKRNDIKIINDLFEPPIEKLKPEAPSRFMFLLEGYQIVDFDGREEELGKLTSWAHSAPTISPNKNVSIALLTGNQGRGKSRLARELCIRARKGWKGGTWLSRLIRYGGRNEEWNGKTWIAGFLRMDAETQDFPCLMKQRRPMLLVIDSAERREELVEKLVSIAFASDRKNHPVRILLVAWAKEEWWGRLERFATNKPLQPNPFKEGKEVKLHSIENNLAIKDRRGQEFNRALKAFREALDPHQPRAKRRPRQWLEVFQGVFDFHWLTRYWNHNCALESSEKEKEAETPEGDILNNLLRMPNAETLDIHIAALLVASGNSAASKNNLFEDLIKMEVGGWEKKIKEQGFTDLNLKGELIRCAIAWLATTDGLTDKKNAEQRLRLLPDFGQRKYEDIVKIVKIAEILYSGDGERWRGGVVSGLLTIWLTHELDDIIEEQPKIVAGLPESALANLLRHLMWRAQLYGDKDEQRNKDEKTLENTIRAGSGQGIFTAAKVGAEIGDPIGKIASRVLRDMEKKHPEIIEIARKVENDIDIETVSLKEFAYVAADILYRNAPDKDKEKCAKRAHCLSIRLSSLGDVGEAIKKGKEAVDLRRELAEALPGAFRSDLAKSLNNWSIDLSADGQRPEALAAIQEATILYRELHRTRPDEFRSDLARALNNLSGCLSDLGEREEAFAAIKDATTLYRELYGARPDEFRFDLARALRNLSVYLSGIGKRGEANKAAEEAVKEFRKLNEVQSDKFLPFLAQSLHTLSVSLSALGERDKALEAIKEAETIRCELANARPDVFHPDLARSLSRLSNCWSALGERDKALEVIKKAVAIFRGLPAARLNKFRPDLAWSLYDLGSCQFACGKREKALEAVGEAVGIFRKLAEDLPKKFRPDLARSLNAQSVFLSALGEPEKGLEAIEEAMSIRLQLAEDLSDAFRPELAKSLINLSARLFDLGRRTEAHAASEESVAIFRELAKSLPGAFRPYLAMSLNSLSRRSSALGAHEEARAASEESVAIFRELAEGLSKKFSPDLARSLHDLSACRTAFGERKEALKASEESVAIFRELAESLPDAFRPDLARSLNHLNDDLGQRDQRGFDAIKESVCIYRELEQIQPNVFRPGLADSLHNLSMSLRAYEDHKGALEAIEEAVRIRRELAEAKPDKFRPALARGLIHLSVCLSSVPGKREEEAFSVIEEAVCICRDVAGKLPDAYGPDLAGSLRNLSNRLSSRKNHDEALAAIEEAVALYRGLAVARPGVFRPYLIGSLRNLGECLFACERRPEALAVNEEARRLDLENRFGRWSLEAVKMFLRVRHGQFLPAKH